MGEKDHQLSRKCTRYCHLNPRELERKTLFSPNNVESSFYLNERQGTDKKQTPAAQIRTFLS